MDVKHNSDSDDDDADLFCPALPPHLLKSQDTSSKDKKRSNIVGPTLPPNYVPSSVEEVYSVHSDEEEKSEEEENVLGPLPSAAADEQRFNVPEMEYRLKQMIKKASEDDKTPVRESWMLELPSDKPNIMALGLGSRQFRKKNVESSGDRSVWTDTPEDKERKSKMKNPPIAVDTEHSIEEVAAKKRDEDLGNMVRTYEEKKRSAPLIDIHMQKKAKTEDSLPKERRPFSREDDLHVNKFDEAQRATILKKARQLNDRFSSGNRKFL